ncbi:hypothetical protein [Sporomusa malonica]|uniref:Spore coat protein Z n=1 Tax=Sporomusa malonica TaxID=112901 RepID=A0A1W2EUL7_9FIRM|nr:hypothetical protein [Sporomusa malonica]SMD13410.1 hypothetical protein SAMN04488500_1315 [Sporomusa malonica]
MAFGGKKSKGFNLDCVLGNAAITVVTCCGYIFQGTIEDDEHTRAKYGCPVVFPAMTMDYGYEKEDEKEDDKDCDKKDDKKGHCPKPVEVDVDVKCENDPKFICLRLDCIPAFTCCDPTSPAALILPVQTITALPRPLFQEDDTVLINVADIVAIGPSRGSCLATLVTNGG